MELNISLPLRLHAFAPNGHNVFYVLFVILAVKYSKVYMFSDGFRASRLSASRELGIAIDFTHSHIPHTHVLCTYDHWMIPIYLVDGLE